MEIDITDFVTNGETWDFSGSIATHGPNAAKNTWANALSEAASSPLLTTEEQLQALRDHVQAMGFGDEVQSYDATQCNALFIQLITSDMREMGLEDVEPEDFDWDAYRERSDGGGSLYVGNIEGSESFGRFFYSLGH